MSGARHHLRFGDREIELWTRAHGDQVDVGSGDETRTLSVVSTHGDTVVLRDGVQHVRGAVRVFSDRVLVSYGGRSWVLERAAAAGAGGGDGADAAGAGTIEAPMTGRVLEVCCAAGDAVEAGTPLLVVEAMKMEHKLLAPAAGLVAAVEVAAGDQVDIGQTLVRIDDGESG